MSPILLGLLFAGAGSVGVHVEEVGELPLAEAHDIARALADRLALRAGGAAVVDDPLWPQCRPRGPCVDEVRARLSADDLVFVRLYGGLTKIRLIAERLSLGDPATAEIDLPRDGADLVPLFDQVALVLYPIAAPPLAATAADIPEEDEAPALGPWPWIAAGATAVIGGVATGFAISNRAARSRLLEPSTVDAFERDRERMRTHGIVANTLFVSAGVGAVVSFILFAAG